MRIDRRGYLAAVGALSVSGLGAGKAPSAPAMATQTSDYNVYDIEDYDAKGDGSTDDTEAIQAAIDDATPGGIIYFPRGTYLVNSVTEQDSDQDYILKVKGFGVTLTGKGTITTTVDRGRTDLLHVEGYDCTIEHLEFKGPGRDTDTHGIHYEPRSDGAVFDVKAHGWGSHLGAIDTSHADFGTVTIANCTIWACWRGIAQSNYQGRLVAIGNRLFNIDQQAIRVTGQGSFVAWNSIEPGGGSGDGLYIRDVADGKVRASYNTFAHNFIWDCHAGVELHSADSGSAVENEFIGNHIRDATFGYDIRGAERTRFTGGSVSNIGFKQFQLGGGANEITIRDLRVLVNQHGNVGTVRLFNGPIDGLDDAKVFHNGILGKSSRGVDLQAVVGQRAGDMVISDGAAPGFPKFSYAIWDGDGKQWVRVDGQETVTP